MLKFIDATKTPLGGFQFIDPDTNKLFLGRNYDSFEALETHVQTYRKQNELPPIENFRAVWEHFICSNNPKLKSFCCPVEADIARTFKQYISGAKTYVASIFQKPEEKFVSQEEADRRADLCRSCIYNRRNIGHHHAQLYTDKVMRKTVGNRRTKFWQQLHTCMVCSCVLNTKVWFSNKLVGKSLRRDEVSRLRTEPKDGKGKFLHCWQLEAFDKVNRDKSEKP